MNARPLRFVLVATACLAGRAAAQVPVQSPTESRTAVQRAEALIGAGQRSEATDLLGRHLAEQPNDGRAWFYLGRIYLDNAQRWHRDGHPDAQPGPLLLEFAGAAMDQAHHLLADSGSVFRVLVSVERAVSRIEEKGWDRALDREIAPEELPLPPVLLELGRNIIASCPVGGLLVSGSLAEVAAVWGNRLGSGLRPDLVLVRSDLYNADDRYRARMAATMGVDSALSLPEALAGASVRRPLCLGPAVDPTAVPSLPWKATGLVFVAGAPAARDTTRLSIHHFATTGLAGSVWTASVRDVYDLAARRDRTLCSGLFAAAERRGLPSIASCQR